MHGNSCVELRPGNGGTDGGRHRKRAGKRHSQCSSDHPSRDLGQRLRRVQFDSARNLDRDLRTESGDDHYTVGRSGLPGQQCSNLGGRNTGYGGRPTGVCVLCESAASGRASCVQRCHRIAAGGGYDASGIERSVSNQCKCDRAGTAGATGVQDQQHPIRGG